jgi:hypothetical protein
MDRIKRCIYEPLHRKTGCGPGHLVSFLGAKRGDQTGYVDLDSFSKRSLVTKHDTSGHVQNTKLTDKDNGDGRNHPDGRNQGNTFPFIIRYRLANIPVRCYGRSNIVPEK